MCFWQRLGWRVACNKLIPVARFKYWLNSQHAREEGILIPADTLRKRRMASRRPPLALRVEARWLSRDWAQVRAYYPALVTDHKDFGRRFPGIASALLKLPSDTVIDGEVVALDRTGRASFSLLQGVGGKEAEIVLYTFDLLMLRGKDVRSWPLEERRESLHEVAQQLPSTIRYSERFEVRLADLISVVRQHGVEGIVAKRAVSPYRSGERSGAWLK